MRWASLPLLAIFAGIVLMAHRTGPRRRCIRTQDGQEDRKTPVGQSNEGRTKVGGVVLIGPIPILFGSDKKMTLIAAAIAIMVLAIMVLLLL